MWKCINGAEHISSDVYRKEYFVKCFKKSQNELSVWKLDKILDTMETDVYRKEVVKSFCDLVIGTFVFPRKDILNVLRCFDTDVYRVDCVKSLSSHIPVLDMNDVCTILGFFDTDVYKVAAVKTLFDVITDKDNWNELMHYIESDSYQSSIVSLFNEYTSSDPPPPQKKQKKEKKEKKDDFSKLFTINSGMCSIQNGKKNFDFILQNSAFGKAVEIEGQLFTGTLSYNNCSFQLNSSPPKVVTEKGIWELEFDMLYGMVNNRVHCKDAKSENSIPLLNTEELMMEKMKKVIPAPAQSPFDLDITEKDIETEKKEREEGKYKDLKEGDFCCICLENRKSCAVMPCKHKCFCFSCAKQNNLTQCPLCKGNLEKIIKVPTFFE
jgi:hypothetical protein